MATIQQFLGCDWGSTSFRLRLVDANSRRILATQNSSDGIKSFASLPAPERADAMARFLAKAIAAWTDLPADLPVIISGMAGSTVGWRDLPYARTPFPLDGSGCLLGRVQFPAAHGGVREARLISGVRSEDDIMRGEECALIGACALHPIAARRPTLALLAGTHPKHALLRDGALQSFHTHLTGELFEVLSRDSLLSASVDRAAAGTKPDLEQFRAGVACVRQRGVSAALFQVRARDVLLRVDKAGNSWFLSGLLVGAELAGLAALPENPDLLLIGDPLRVELYRVALGVLRGDAAPSELAVVDLTDAVVAGQTLILQRHDFGNAI